MSRDKKAAAASYQLSRWLCSTAGSMKHLPDCIKGACVKSEARAKREACARAKIEASEIR
jgi:hypothetical protein